MDPTMDRLPWATLMEDHLRTMQGNWPAHYWIRWDHGYSGSVDQYKRYSYGSLLLGYRATATRFQYGGPWKLSKPDRLYFWEWGAPSTLPTTLESLRVSGTGLYARSFAKGVVVVNPTSTAIRYTPPQAMYSVGGTTEPVLVTSIQVPARDAVFLQLSDSSSTSPTVSIAEPVRGSTVAPGLVIAGEATADLGVAGVTVAIRDRDTGLWWRSDGTWGARENLPALLAEPNAQRTNWRYGWLAPSAGRYRVVAQSVDSSGRHDASQAATAFNVSLVEL
jgi:hypothetical protein